MQADKITNRILEDANLKANSVLKEAETQAKSIIDKATEYANNKKAEILKKEILQQYKSVRQFALDMSIP